jgi:hypothetical protein
VRRDGDREVDGATVVRAMVHARLLGLRLLTLDARVVVAPMHVEPTSLDLMTPAGVADKTPSVGQVRAVATPAGPALADRPPSGSADGGVRRARELLAEGTHTLARAGRSG